MAPLCCRKAATEGHRLLCAAADATSFLLHTVSSFALKAASLAPVPPSWPGLFFGGGAVAMASGVAPAQDPRLQPPAARWCVPRSRAIPLGLECVDGLGVVVVVVVVAGEAAAWTITDLTTGLTQRSGKTSGLNEPPTARPICAYPIRYCAVPLLFMLAPTPPAAPATP